MRKALAVCGNIVGEHGGLPPGNLVFYELREVEHIISEVISDKQKYVICWV